MDRRSGLQFLETGSTKRIKSASAWSRGLKGHTSPITLVAAAFLAALLTPAMQPAIAQAPASMSNPTTMKLPPITPIAKPANPDEIPLYPGASRKADDEQWFMYLGARTVRNVVRPTVTPFLPVAGKATGAAIILAPGGAFRYLGYEDEERNAKRLAEQGIAAFVLKYRTLPTSRDGSVFLSDLYKYLFSMAAATGANTREIGLADVPSEALADAQAAMRLVRGRAAEWGIDPHRVGFMGGSAGAMTAVAVGLSADEAVRPDFIGSVIGPKAVKEVPAYAPPLFIAAASDDPLFPATQETIVSAWAKAKRPVEAHFYERGGHGLPKGTTGENWLDAFYAWMQMRGIVPKPQ